MNEIGDINKIDLNNFSEVEQNINFIIFFDLTKEAFLLARRMEEKMKLENRSWKLGEDKNDDFLIKLKWVALPKLNDEEVIGMFGKYFTKVFGIETYNVWQKLKIKIVSDILYEQRDEFKNKLKKALLQNEEMITDKKIIINGKECVSTVANWLMDYNVSLGLESVNVTRQSQYLTNSQNIKNLSAEEKKKLGELFQLYEKLKLSSLTAAGFEEGLYIDEDGIRGVLNEGMFTKFDIKEEKRIEFLTEFLSNVGRKEKEDLKDNSLADANIPHEEYLEEKVSKAYVFTLNEQELIKQEEEDIKRIARGNIILIGKELTKALNQKNRIRTIAALRMAVKNNLLLGWAKKNNKTLMEFLKEILENRLGLNENEAAKIGVHLYNLLKKLGRETDYVAYFDEGEEKFKWFNADK